MSDTYATAGKLPPPTVIHAALGVTTERLAAELAAPLATAPDWSAFEWRAARAVVAMHGVAGRLATALRWQGPAGWQAFLVEQHAHTANRQARLACFLGELDAALAAGGVAAVALKGAALHAAGLYRAGERPMADLDLLAAPAHLEAVGAVLGSLGYHEGYRTAKHRVFVSRTAQPPARFGEHASNDIKVELHDGIWELLPLERTDITSRILRPDARPGLNPYPSHAALYAHLLLHAAGAMVFRSVRLIQLNDLALLAPLLTPADWCALSAADNWWALPPQMLAERYFGPLAPAPMREALSRACPPWLRRASARQELSDVSLSRLWVDAFPGLEWSRGAAEAVRYMSARLLPGPRVRAERRALLVSEPSLSEGDWARLSQRRRIARFLRARPARPWPLYNMRAALDGRH